MKQKNLFKLILVFFSLLGLNVSNAHGANPPSHWPEPIVGTNSMTMVVSIKIDGVVQTSDQIEIGAFAVSNDVCRGSGFV